jgi:hypothetical protein
VTAWGDEVDAEVEGYEDWTPRVRPLGGEARKKVMDVAGLCFARGERTTYAASEVCMAEWTGENQEKGASG